MSSQVTNVFVVYSNSALDLATKFCILHLQIIKLPQQENNTLNREFIAR